MDFNFKNNLEKYRTRMITNVKLILSDKNQTLALDELEEIELLKKYFEEASEMDLIMALATQRLATLKKQWAEEDALLNSILKS